MPSVIASQSRRTSDPRGRSHGQHDDAMGRHRSARGEQIAPIAPVLEEPIEVALAQAVALGLGERRPTTVLVALERQRSVRTARQPRR